MCDGGDLDGLLKREGSISKDEIPKIILAVSQALHYLGQEGIIHRDVKVSNIFRH